MSQMPDKIWLHKDTKYSTADTVCGYQYKFLAENEGIENFVEYIRTDVFVKKFEEWIKNVYSKTDCRFKEDFTGMLINNFKNYMKGE